MFNSLIDLNNIKISQLEWENQSLIDLGTIFPLSTLGAAQEPLVKIDFNSPTKIGQTYLDGITKWTSSAWKNWSLWELRKSTEAKNYADTIVSILRTKRMYDWFVEQKGPFIFDNTAWSLQWSNSRIIISQSTGDRDSFTLPPYPLPTFQLAKDFYKLLIGKEWTNTLNWDPNGPAEKITALTFIQNNLTIPTLEGWNWQTGTTWKSTEFININVSSPSLWVSPNGTPAQIEWYGSDSILISTSTSISNTSILYPAGATKFKIIVHNDPVSPPINYVSTQLPEITYELNNIQYTQLIDSVTSGVYKIAIERNRIYTGVNNIRLISDFLNKPNEYGWFNNLQIPNFIEFSSNSIFSLQSKINATQVLEFKNVNLPTLITDDELIYQGKFNIPISNQLDTQQLVGSRVNLSGIEDQTWFPKIIKRFKFFTINNGVKEYWRDTNGELVSGVSSDWGLINGYNNLGLPFIQTGEESLIDIGFGNTFADLQIALDAGHEFFIELELEWSGISFKHEYLINKLNQIEIEFS